MSIVPVAKDLFAERSRKARGELYKDDPVLWAREYLGIELWSKQREIIESIRDNRNTAVAAGHGVGKTFVAGVAVAWWVSTHPPEDTFVASTAPSVDQVRLLWDNVRRLQGIAQDRYEKGLVDHPLPGYITGDNMWKLEDGSLLGQGRKPPDAKSDVAFQGRHAKYLLAIGDEAVGLAPGFLGALGNIATGSANRQLLLANPTDPGCAMAKLWADHITSWNRMHISVFDSPAVTGEDFELPEDSAISGWDYINEKREEWGEEDARYIARVLGQWAFDSGNTVFTAEDLASAKNTHVLPDPAGAPEVGWDIARMGADSSVGYTLEKGEVWETDGNGKPVKTTGRVGFRIRRRAKWSKAPLTGTNPQNPGSSERIHEIALADGHQLVKVDASGIGSGVLDGLYEIGGNYQVVEVFAGAPATDPRAYVNMRAELFFQLKADMNAGTLDLDPSDEDLIEELMGVQYEHNDKGVVKIESKESIRKSGRKSPDHADACWMARLDVAHMLSEVNRLAPGSTMTVDPYDVIDMPQWGDRGYVM